MKRRNKADDHGEDHRDEFKVRVHFEPTCLFILFNFSQARSHARSQSRALTHAHSPTHTVRVTDTKTLTYSRTHKHAHKNTHTHIHTHAHTQKETDKYTGRKLGTVTSENDVIRCAVASLYEVVSVRWSRVIFKGEKYAY